MSDDKRGKASGDNGTLLHEWHLCSTMIVRATLGEYRGRRVLDLRKYFESASGCFLPSRKGLALEASAENLRELEKALRAARKQLEKEGATP